MDFSHNDCLPKISEEIAPCLPVFLAVAFNQRIGGSRQNDTAVAAAAAVCYVDRSHCRAAVATLLLTLEQQSSQTQYSSESVHGLDTVDLSG